MKGKLRIVGIIVIVLVVIIIALPFFVNVNSFRPKLESELTNALGRQVTVGNLDLSILSGSVGAQDLSIADDPAFSQAPFVKAKSLKVGVELMPLIFSKSLRVTGLTLDQPDINLLHAPSGKWNFSSLGSAATTKNGSTGSAPPAAETKKEAPQQAAKPASEGSSTAVSPNLSVAKLNITSGRLSIGKTQSKEKPQVYDKVNIEVRDFSFTSQFPFALSANLPGGGDLKLDGKAGPISAEDASLTPFDAQIKIAKLDLAASGFVDPATGIAGLANFEGRVNSDGKQVHTTGTLNADKLKLSPKGSPAARTVQVKYTLDHDLQKQSGSLTQGDVNIGKAVAHLTGGYRIQGDTTLLNMKLAAPGMPVDELEAMLPALGVVLPSGSSLKGGTLSTTLDIAGPVDKLVITGPVRLADTKLAGFNLGSKLSAVSALAGNKSAGPDTSIQNFSSNVRVAPNGIQTQQINLTVPSLGEITGDGTISPNNALDFKMNAKLAAGSAVAGLGQLAGMGGATSGTLPFLIQGTTSNPTFVPDVKGMVGSKLKGLGNTGIPGGKSPVDALTGLFGKKKPK
jgi:AsmA protein